MIIDGLCDAIRNGQSVPEFISLLKQLYQNELTHIHNESRETMRQSFPAEQNDEESDALESVCNESVLDDCADRSP